MKLEHITEGETVAPLVRHFTERLGILVARDAAEYYKEMWNGMSAAERKESGNSLIMLMSAGFEEPTHIEQHLEPVYDAIEEAYKQECQAILARLQKGS